MPFRLFPEITFRVVPFPAPEFRDSMKQVAAAIAFPFLNQPSSPQFKDRNVVVQWTGPPGAGLDEMNRITSRVSASLRSLPSVSDVAATLGRATTGDRIVDTNSGQIFVHIKPQADYGRAMSGIRGIVVKKLGANSEPLRRSTPLKLGRPQP